LRRYEEVIRFCGETMHLAERNSVSMCLDEHPENINLDSYSSSVKSWRYYLITKSYFFMGKLEEAHQFLKKHEDATLVEYKCGEQSQQSVSSLSKTISELLHLKVAGNEAFQAGKYSEAVEHYTAALLSNTESLHFSAICFGNRAAAYQAMGHILDAIADCSLAIALDTSYCKVISRRASLYELIRDYSQAENDLRRLISLLEEQLQENMSTPSEKLDNVRNNLHRANLRLSALERDARKRNSLDIYLILGIEPSCSAANIKKAYRKAALRHHPDKVLYSLHLGIFLNSSVR
jgi:DnaJ family protein C protein 7